MSNQSQKPAIETTSQHRRGFITKGLAISALTVAGGLVAAGAPLRGALGQQPGREEGNALVILAETGDVFETEIVPGSVVETQDPKLGNLLRMELSLDGFGKRDVSVRELTDKIEKLALVHQELHRPPTALLTWGTGLKLKVGLLAAATGFSLLARDGTPVRARMLLDFVVLG